MSESKHTPEPVESCDTCKNNGGTRGECQNESCAYEPKTKPLEVELAALRKQCDELLAALGSGGRHCNDDTPHSDLCEAIIDSKEADLGQGLDPFWKWAFRRGFHEAETSYKVDIATLEQQRDELLSDLAEAKRSAEFNFEQYQDVGRLLHEECEKTEKLLAALEKCRKELSAWMRDHGDDIATQEAVADARAAIASVKGGE